MPTDCAAYFYRPAAGAEIDLVLDLANELWAIAIKRTKPPKLTKGFHLACEDIKPVRKWVVFGGEDECQIRDNITILSLSQMMDKFI